MKNQKGIIRWSIFVCLLGIFFIFAAAPDAGAVDWKKLLDRFKEFKPAKPLLPPDVPVMSEFVVGKGDSVGTVQKIQGTVYVIHKDEKVAYPLKKTNPLFVGDTLITQNRSRVYTLMNDESKFALAPNSKLVIQDLVYDRKKKKGASILKMLFGRLRCKAWKIPNRRYSVRTPTAVCGVRGSDFAISVGPADKERSSLKRFFKNFSLVREAHAQGVESLVTVVVTGPTTTVSFTGTIGTLQMVAPASLSAATAGAAAIAPMGIGAAAATATLTMIAPELAVLSMPSHLD